MLPLFYISAAVAVIATFMAITRLNAVHALLYLIVSLLAVAAVFFCLGAAFIAALEVIVYAGAIMVLFVFRDHDARRGPAGRAGARPVDARRVGGPGLLSAILLGEMLYALARATGTRREARAPRRGRWAFCCSGPTSSPWRRRLSCCSRGWWGRITSAGGRRGNLFHDTDPL